MRILFLSRWFPYPSDNGSKIRIHNLLKGLSQFHEVTLLSFYDPRENTLEDIQKYPFCSEVQVIPWKPFDATSKKARVGLFSSSPRSLLDTHSPQMEMLIRDSVSSQKFDLIIASQLTMASYYPVFGDVPAIFEEVELGLYLDQAFNHGSWIRRIRLMLTWLKLKRYFSRLLAAFSLYTVVSEQERQIFVDNFKRYKQKVKVFPNCINLDEYQGIHGTSDGCKLIFAGSFRYRPNYDAMQWFIRDVYPLILQKHPEVQLLITGDHADLPLPRTKNVTLTGRVDDIKSLIASCTVSIAPLWSGGGTRLKILEAMAMETPVVATSKGAEGLMVRDGEHIFITDEPLIFAEDVMKLLNERELRDRLSSNALQLVRHHYDWPTMIPIFLSFVEQLTAT